LVLVAAPVYGIIAGEFLLFGFITEGIVVPGSGVVIVCALGFEVPS
jgi:hypothetical protein